MKKFILLFFAVAAIILEAATPKYIFLFIGDGMSIPQRMIAEEFSKSIGNGNLAMNSLPMHATTRTSSANQLITDSAAAATAIACGVKTNNGMVGVTPDGKKVQSVAELAHEKGKKVGIISSVTLNHATPAGFYGHRNSRGEYYNLGLDMAASGFEFFGGGGFSAYDQKQPDIYTIAKKAGYTVARGKEELDALKKETKVIALAGSLNSSMPYSIDIDKDKEPTLADITAKAAEMLDNPEGFFIMVEGGAIDWAGHANEAAANLFDVLALDEAVKTALEFYKKHPGETLIIVTGDHETGGMTMGFSGSGYNMNLKLLAMHKCSIGKFNHILKKAAAEKKDFSFEDAKKLMTKQFGFKFNAADKKDPLYIAPAEEAALKKSFTPDKPQLLGSAVRVIANRKSGIGWSSGNHTALPVLTTSIGCKSELFVGLMENCDISLKLKSIL